jgi:hypothetical protein
LEVIPVREPACVHDGTCYPTNHVVATFDSQPDAEGAGAALRDSDFTDVGLFHGPDAYAAIVAASSHESSFTRLWRRLRDLGGDEGELHERCLLTLRRGGSYLIVHADTSEQASHARDILVSHNAHDIWRLGSWSLERLPDGRIAPAHSQSMQ